MASKHAEHSEDLHFRVLKLLQDEPDLSQRELAQRLGVSNGKLHYCMKALIDKGLVKLGNFAQSKHASVFEAVELGVGKPKVAGQHANPEEKLMHVIQKMMSVPVMGPAGVAGVIQVSRKGRSAPEAGGDFTPADLQKLVAIAASLAKCFK